MRVSDTIARLRSVRAGSAADASGRLTDLLDFGPNPGNLRARIYVPERVAEQPGLVVVLHGCTQTAAVYDQGSGWSKLADRHGFLLLFPEQQRANNPNLCFNWFQPADARRDSGEAASIEAMVRRVQESYSVDPARIFVTGLSAGGAMASVMLATYPDVFAGGAIIAGVAYGRAGTVGEAFESMAGVNRDTAAALGAHVRSASGHKGPWPRVSVWHGDADRTVSAVNGDDVVKQWLDVHGLPARPSEEGRTDSYPHRVWAGADGRPIVEQYVITGMGHGTPLSPGDEAGQSGEAGPHMLDAAISSTDRIAAFFGVAEGEPEAVRNPRKMRAALAPSTAPQAEPRQATTASAGVQDVIENALRAAGLMR